jgi:hypothetical protein
MARTLTIHLIAQALLILFFVCRETAVIALNHMLDFVGVDPYDSHVYLGVYVYPLFAIGLPWLYLLASERVSVMRLPTPPWALRVEVILLTAAGLVYFFS